MMVLVNVMVPHLSLQQFTPNHGWELPVNYPVFTVLMEIYCYDDNIG